MAPAGREHVDRDRLAGVWFHSHEEDEDDRLVYRGPAYEFPRARAPRDSITIEADGSVAFGQAGPADSSTLTRGSWSDADEGLTLSTPGEEVVFEVQSVDADVLVLRRRAKRRANGGDQEE